MVSNKLFLFIHQRLIEIFGCVSDFKQPFVGITMIVVGDFYQLPPVLQRPVYAQFYNELYNIYHLWRNFKMCELVEIMRQRGDNTLIDLLNNITVGTLTTEDEQLLKSRFISTTDKNYPHHALHIFAENEPARCHNQNMLNIIDSPSIKLVAIDQVPNGVPNHVYNNKVLGFSQSKTGGLAHTLIIKLGAKVMLTSNIDIKDKLINGQIGTVVHIEKHYGIVKTVFVKFDQEGVGSEKIRSNRIAQQYQAVPIQSISVDIRTIEKNPIFTCH